MSISRAIAGTVVDVTGDAPAMSWITARSDRWVATVATGNGTFELRGLPPDRYRLTASDALAYGSVFAAEGGVFLIAAFLAMSLGTQPKQAPAADLIPGE